jgi:hypothetical protein
MTPSQGPQDAGRSGLSGPRGGQQHLPGRGRPRSRLTGEVRGDHQGADPVRPLAFGGGQVLELGDAAAELGPPEREQPPAKAQRGIGVIALAGDGADRAPPCSCELSASPVGTGTTSSR